MHNFIIRLSWLMAMLSLSFALHAQNTLANLKNQLQSLDGQKKYAEILSLEEEISCYSDSGDLSYAFCLFYLSKASVKEFDNLPQAYVFFQKSEDLFQQSEEFLYQSQCMFYEGVIQFYLRNYETAISDYRRAIDLQKEYAPEELDATYNALAGLCKVLQRYPQAIDYYLESLELKKQYKPDEISIVYNNLATVYREIGQLNKAKAYIDSCFASTSDLAILDDANTNLGVIYETEATMSGDTSLFYQALEAHREALIIREELGNGRDLLNTYLNLGANYQNLENYEQARNIYEQAIDLSKDLEGIDDLRAILYINLSDAYYALSEDDPSLTYLKQYLNLYDSTRLKETMLTRLMHFERLQKEKELAEKEKLIAKQKEELAKSKLYWVSIALMLLIGLLIVSAKYYQHQKRDQEIIIAQNEETIRQQDIILVQERKIGQQEKVQLLKNHAQDLVGERMKSQEQTLRKIARDLHDHIGNRITALLWGLSEKDDTQKFVRTQLSEIYDQVEGISQFLKPRGLQNGLLPSLGELCSDVEKGGLKVNLHTFQIRWRRFAPEVELNVFRIVQEALTNIIKYAEASEVNIQLIHNTKEGECLNITIEDNGKGFDLNTYKPGIGISNMEDRAKELKGTFHIDSTPGQGTIIFIEIPAEVKGIRSEKREEG